MMLANCANDDTDARTGAPVQGPHRRGIKDQEEIHP